MSQQDDKPLKKMKNKFFFTQKQEEVLEWLKNNPFFDFVNLRDNGGNTVLHFATNYNNLIVIRDYLIRVKDPAYWKAIEDTNITIDSIKFRAKQWINVRNNDGLTAMHYASLKGHVEMIKLLEINGGNALKTA